MIENLPDELYQLESEDAKGAKLCVNIKFTKNAPKLISMYLEKETKIKQFLSYILMIRKQNILATLMIFLNQLKHAKKLPTEKSQMNNSILFRLKVL